MSTKDTPKLPPDLLQVLDAWAQRKRMDREQAIINLCQRAFAAEHREAAVAASW